MNTKSNNSIISGESLGLYANQALLSGESIPLSVNERVEGILKLRVSLLRKEYPGIVTLLSNSPSAEDELNFILSKGRGGALESILDSNIIILIHSLEDEFRPKPIAALWGEFSNPDESVIVGHQDIDQRTEARVNGSLCLEAYDGDGVNVREDLEQELYFNFAKLVLMWGIRSCTVPSNTESSSLLNNAFFIAAEEMGCGLEIIKKSAPDCEGELLPQSCASTSTTLH